jgi:hypothetical protein
MVFIVKLSYVKVKGLSPNVYVFGGEEKGLTSLGLEDDSSCSSSSSDSGCWSVLRSINLCGN